MTNVKVNEYVLMSKDLQRLNALKFKVYSRHCAAASQPTIQTVGLLGGTIIRSYEVVDMIIAGVAFRG